MTEWDGSKARASAICIRRGHLLWITGALPEKTAVVCLFGRQKPMDLIPSLGEDARAFRLVLPGEPGIEESPGIEGPFETRGVAALLTMTV